MLGRMMRKMQPDRRNERFIGKPRVQLNLFKGTKDTIKKRIDSSVNAFGIGRPGIYIGNNEPGSLACIIPRNCHPHLILKFKT